MFKSVQTLYAYDKGYRLYVGHDYPKTRGVGQFTTVEQEGIENLQVNFKTDSDSFVQFRDNRDAGLDVPKLLYPSLIFNIKAGKPPKCGFVKVPVTAPHF